MPREVATPSGQGGYGPSMIALIRAVSLVSRRTVPRSVSDGPRSVAATLAAVTPAELYDAAPLDQPPTADTKLLPTRRQIRTIQYQQCLGCISLIDFGLERRDRMTFIRALIDTVGHIKKPLSKLDSHKHRIVFGGPLGRVLSNDPRHGPGRDSDVGAFGYRGAVLRRPRPLNLDRPNDGCVDQQGCRGALRCICPERQASVKDRQGGENPRPPGPPAVWPQQ